MQLRFISRCLWVGVIACAIIGWWLLPIPPTQAEESSVGGRSEAPKALRNPTSADRNQILPIKVDVGRNPRGSDIELIPPPATADTGCYVLRGDMDHSGAYDIADLTYTVGYLFRGGPPPVCAEEGDVDASGELDIADLTYFVAYLFLGGHAPPIPQGKDYVVWYENGGNWDEQLQGYHVLTHEIDTATPGVYIKWSMVASPDGSMLYGADNGWIYVLSTMTWQIVDSLPYSSGGGLAISPDGNLLAVMADHLLILNTSDYSVAYEDTSYVQHGVFSASSRSFYCASYNSVIGSHYYKVDLDSLAVTRKLIDSAKSYRILPSIDETKWFLYVVFGGAPYFSFKVYDVAADSIIFHDPITPGKGYLAMTPDGKRVVYTNPGSTSPMDPPPPSEFTIYDVENNQIDTVINTAFWDCGPNAGYYPVGEVVITPDGNWLVGAYAQGTGGPFLFNLNTYELEECIWIPGGDILPYLLTVQTQL